MLPRKIITYLLVGLASLFVVAIAWVFFPGAIDQWPRTLTVWQKMETSIQLICGPLGILAVLISPCFHHVCGRWPFGPGECSGFPWPRSLD